MRQSPHAAACIFTLVLFLVGVPSFGHNRNVIHPHLTREAIDLVRHHDVTTYGGTDFSSCIGCAYDELYLNGGPLRGPGQVPVDSRETEMTTDEEPWGPGAYFEAFSAAERDIVLGSVIEDGEDDFGPNLSATRVFHHFHHARSGLGLDLPGFSPFRSSLSRAQEIFLLSLRLHDYSEDGRRESFHYLGRVLHLIEDLSSPAHVHDNAHYPAGESTDDYEGRWVPGVWVRQAENLGEVNKHPADGVGLLGGVGNPAPIDSFRDIWSEARNPTNADVPWEVGSGDEGFSAFIFNRSVFRATLQFPGPFDPAPDPPAGELAQMFPNGRLRWDTTATPNRWRIDDYDYFHTLTALGAVEGGSEWWPVTAGDSIDSDGLDDQRPSGVEVEYYLEQLQSTDDPVTALVPDAYRANYDLPPYHPENYMVPNPLATPLAEIWARNLLVPAVEQVAGFAMWWYRIADTPPYLLKVEARNEAEPMAYQAEWVVDPQQGDTVAETLVLAELLDFDTSIDHTVVVKRTFQHTTLRTHLHGRSDVVLMLTFNEPVREVQELTLGALDVKAVALEEANGDQTVWTFTIPAAEVTGAPLDGEVVLTVKAIDENEHWPHDPSVPGPSDCRNAGHLDETPHTPAKRIYPEHTEVLEPGNENLLVEPGLSLPWADASTKPEFAYECENGDQNHRLLFDTTPPTVTTTLSPEG